MRRFTVAISDSVAARLAELAARDLREPKAQAALLLADAVERAMHRADHRPPAALQGRHER
jgi:predicted transcriptional regulator